MTGRALLGLDGRDARPHTIFPGRNLIRREVSKHSPGLLLEGREISSAEENLAMSTSPAAGPSESVPDPNRETATSPTPVSRVVDFREGPARGAAEEPRLHGVSEV